MGFWLKHCKSKILPHIAFYLKTGILPDARLAINP
jgi:hypothetical protein